MPVFSPKKEALLKNELGKLYDRAIRQHRTPDLSPDNIYRMLVRRDHIPRLLEVDGLVGAIQTHSTINTTGSTNGHSARLGINFSQPLERLMPAYISQGFCADALPEHVELVQNWLDRRFKIGLVFSRAAKLFDYLNKKLNTPTQMMFYFNGILPLLEANVDTQKVAAKVREAGVPSSFPSISPEARRMGVEATQEIARAMLLPNDPPPPAAVTFLVTKETFGSELSPLDPDKRITVW